MEAIISKSETIKADLNKWFQDSRFTDIKFFVAPNIDAGVEECSAQVLESVLKLDKGELKSLNYPL